MISKDLKNHNYHLALIKDFLNANKYILSDVMQESLIDAIKCMELVRDKGNFNLN